MSLQNFTKSLRDKATPIADRTNAAIQVECGEVQIYMPRKELILAEWALSALTTEPQARESQQLWAFFAQLWIKLDKNAQVRLSRTHKLAQILIDTFKLKLSRGTVEAVEAAIKAILQSTVLVIASTAQAEALLIGYLSHVKGQPSNILGLLEAQIGNRKKIFKESPKILSVLLGAANTFELLVDYFSVPSLNIACTDEDVSLVMRAIVASQTQVSERFTALSKAHPLKVHSLLSTMGSTNLDRKLLKDVFAEQIKLKQWDCVRLILERNPYEVVASSTTLVEAMDADFDLDLSLLIIQLSSQMRQFDKFVSIWATTTTNPQWKAAPIVEALKRGMDQLSAHQLEELLQDTRALKHVLGLLSYRAVKAENIQQELKQLYEMQDPTLCLPILNVWPEVAGDFSSQTSDLCCALVLLEQGKGDPKLCGKLCKSFKGPTGAIIGRFFPVLDDVECAALFSSITQQDFERLARVGNLFEYPHVSSLLLERALEAKWPSAPFEYVPLEGVSKPLKVRILDYSWTQHDLATISHLLEYPLGSNQESDPKFLVNLAAKVDEEDCDLFFNIVSKLARSQSYKQALGDLLKPSNSWSHACMAQLCGLDSSVLVSNLSSGKDLKVTLKALIREPISLDPKQLGALVGGGYAEDVFCLICRCSDDWLAVSALYVYNGYTQSQEFQKFLQRLDSAHTLSLFKASVVEHRYQIVGDILAAGVLENAQVVPYITFMVQSIFTTPSKLNGEQLEAFFGLMVAIVRDHAWVASQYALETMMGIIAKVCATSDINLAGASALAVYKSMSLALSMALLFQRHRLGGRNHLVLAALSGLLKSLGGVQLNSEQRARLDEYPAWLATPELLHSAEAADSFARTLANYCEPPQRTVRENAGKNNLTSSVARVRRQVAKTIGVLLANYVTVAVQYGFSSTVQSSLQQAAFSMFDVLSSTELQSVIASMDNAGRPYIKAVYNAYDAQGKWKKD